MPTKEEYIKNIAYYKSQRNSLAHKEAQKRWSNKNKEKVKDGARRRRFKINNTVYEELKKQAEGRCGLCLKEVDKLVLDHDHTTKTVRKFLCYNCNTGLGHFGDSIELLERAIKYIKQFRDDGEGR